MDEIHSLFRWLSGRRANSCLTRKNKNTTSYFGYSSFSSWPHRELLSAQSTLLMLPVVTNGLDKFVLPPFGQHNFILLAWIAIPKTTKLFGSKKSSCHCFHFRWSSVVIVINLLPGKWMARVEEKDMALWLEQHANVNWVQVVEQQAATAKWEERTPRK